MARVPQLCCWLHTHSPNSIRVHTAEAEDIPAVRRRPTAPRKVAQGGARQEEAASTPVEHRAAHGKERRILAKAHIRVDRRAVHGKERRIRARASIRVHRKLVHGRARRTRARANIRVGRKLVLGRARRARGRANIRANGTDRPVIA